MKRCVLFIMVLMCLPVSSFAQKASQKKADRIRFIDITWIDFYISIITGLDCNDFDKFKGWYSPNTVRLYDSLEQKKISDYLKDSKEAVFNGVDTRAKMFIHYYSGKIDTFCLGSTIAFYYNNQGRLLKDRGLIEYIINLKKDN